MSDLAPAVDRRSDSEPHTKLRGSLRVGHLECPSGVAGDMFLGACLDAGAPVAVLDEVVARLGLEGVSIESRSALRGGMRGTRFRVLRDGLPIEGPDPEEVPRASDRGEHDHSHSHSHSHEHEHPEQNGGDTDHSHACGGAVEGLDHHHGAGGQEHSHSHRSWSEIRQLIENSDLQAEVRERSLELFADLAEVEGDAHGIDPGDVHFHEVGAIDSIVDIVGSCAMFQALGLERLTCGTIVVGSGTVGTAHGRLPVPAPATANLLKGIPTRGGGSGELVTPTGALLLKHLVSGFGPQPLFVAESHGYGLGKRDLADRPNAVRLTIGTETSPGESPQALATGRVTVLETQVDDVSGEQLGWVMEALLEAGALDVFAAPVLMKKGRPGQLVCVIARPHEAQGLAELLLRESGSLGCRFRDSDRFEVGREVREVATRYGSVRIKLAAHVSFDGATPEYEDCRERALEHGVRWREVYEAAVEAWRSAR